MALGALAATPGLKIQIIPTGLSYFHPHKFRSRAVIEFGAPLNIPQILVDDFEKGGDNKKAAITAVLNLIFDGLKAVTVRAPDYDTLMVCSFFVNLRDLLNGPVQVGSSNEAVI